MKKQNLTKEEITNLINIGFCQPRFYKRSVWLKAKKIMDYLCSLNIGVKPYDFGRGKGKYINSNNNLSTSQLVDYYHYHLKND